MLVILGHVGIFLALLAFALASGLFVHSYAAAHNKETFIKVSFHTFLAGSLCLVLAHAGLILSGVHGVRASVYLIECLSIITLIAFYAFKLRLIGLLVAPLATLLLLYEIFTLPARSQLAEAPSSFLRLHIGSAILGQSFAILAGAISVVYLLQHLALKRKRIQNFSQISPPIDRLEQALLMSLWTGFILITCALVTGAAYTQFFASGASSGLSFKIIWSIAVWAYYFTVLIGRNVFDLSGKKVAQLALGGFILLAIAFFGLVSPGGGAAF